MVEVSGKSASDENLHPNGCNMIGRRMWDCGVWGMDGPSGIMGGVFMPPAFEADLV